MNYISPAFQSRLLKLGTRLKLHQMVRYTIYLICIFMIINEHIKVMQETGEKTRKLTDSATTIIDVWCYIKSDTIDKFNPVLLHIKKHIIYIFMDIYKHLKMT